MKNLILCLSLMAVHLSSFAADIAPATQAKYDALCAQKYASINLQKFADAAIIKNVNRIIRNAYQKISVTLTDKQITHKFVNNVLVTNVSAGANSVTLGTELPFDKVEIKKFTARLNVNDIGNVLNNTCTFQTKLSKNEKVVDWGEKFQVIRTDNGFEFGSFDLIMLYSISPEEL